MASSGPQTYTYTETVNGGSAGTFDASEWVGITASAGSNTNKPQVFHIQLPAGTTSSLAGEASHDQVSSQKCLLQIDLVENDTNTTQPASAITGPMSQVPELVRRCAASQATLGGSNDTSITQNAYIKSVYVRIEYTDNVAKNS